jgi:cytochrome c-type biogenesis protein CcmH/NrfF
MSDSAQAYEKAANALLCDCGCHPQSIQACACGRADELRQSIAAEASSGKSGDQIIAEHVARVGPQILVTPPASGFNLVAWTGPAVGLLAAALLISFMIRRWRRTDAALPALPRTEPAADDEAYRARLRREIEELR